MIASKLTYFAVNSSPSWGACAEEAIDQINTVSLILAWKTGTFISIYEEILMNKEIEVLTN